MHSWIIFNLDIWKRRGGSQKISLTYPFGNHVGIKHIFPVNIKKNDIKLQNLIKHILFFFSSIITVLYQMVLGPLFLLFLTGVYPKAILSTLLIGYPQDIIYQ